ncbi:MAG TPA: ribulose-phosphate 3-epimerase [Gaiellaceae bacterium]|nr:ribulose-phosphate 3-epimerase [Gaiellaceae bacterium]
MGWHDWIRGLEIEPSLYAADFARLGEQIEALLDAGARVFHYDVGDGHFVEPITIGPIVIESIADVVHGRGAVLDCHLMVDNPERHIPQVARAGGDSVTFHVEVTDNPGSLIELARSHELGVGVAFKPKTAVEDAARAAAGADIALCMSIEPGYSGQAFMPEALDRIARLRELLPLTPIQVDGGIGPDTIGPACEAGASLFVAGTSIFGQGDVAAAYAGLVELAR